MDGTATLLLIPIVLHLVQNPEDLHAVLLCCPTRRSLSIPGGQKFATTFPQAFLRQIKLTLRSEKQMHMMKGMLFMEVL